MDGSIDGEDHRDFLGEAARLALQLDPLAWEFDMSDRQQHTPHEPTASFQQVLPEASVGGRHNSRGTNMAPWQHQASSYSTQDQEPVHMQSTPFEIGDFNHFKQIGPKSYDYPIGGSIPARLTRDSLRQQRSGSISDPMFIDHMDHFNPRSMPSNINTLGSWQNPQTWQDGVKSEAGGNGEASEIASLRAKLERARKDKDELEKHATILERALMTVSQQEDKAKEIPDFVPSRGWTSFDPSASVVVDTLFDPPKRISAEDAAHIPLREYAQLWRSYLGAVKDVLKDCRPEPHTGTLSPAEEKLKALLTERHGFLSWVAANNPSICHCLLTMDMGSDPPQKIHAGLSPEKTREILDKMALTERQSSFLLDARNQFLLSMGYHSAALFKLQQQLSNLDPNPKESVRNCHFLNWLHVARSLQETVEEMHICGVTFHCKLYKLKSGITPYQAAVLMIESFPYLPDVVALVSEVGSSKGAPTAEDLFKLGRERYLANPAAAELKFVREPHPSINSRIGKIAAMLEKWEVGN